MFQPKPRTGSSLVNRLLTWIISGALVLGGVLGGAVAPALAASPTTVTATYGAVGTEYTATGCTILTAGSGVTATVKSDTEPQPDAIAPPRTRSHPFRTTSHGVVGRVMAKANLF